MRWLRPRLLFGEPAILSSLTQTNAESLNVDGAIQAATETSSRTLAGAQANLRWWTVRRERWLELCGEQDAHRSVHVRVGDRSWCLAEPRGEEAEQPR